MYQVKCDDYILMDPRDEDLVLLDPRIKLEVNTVGEGSFTILPSHPFYDKLHRLKSVFSVLQDGQTIFRGRMTNDSRDFENRLEVDLEGVMAYANDSIIPPFTFPDDFEIPEGANAVEVLLAWGLQQHNDQVQPWQQLRLGTVTVQDPNNYIVRSSEKYLSTWDFLKDKLFDSALGGNLCIRYEADGNYIDYLADFPLTNAQRITFGENMLDITTDSEGSEIYTAILPLGAEIGEDGEVKRRLDLSSLPDGDLTDNVVKAGLHIYSKSAVAAYGWICCPIDGSTWDDVGDAVNLRRKAMEQLITSGVMLDNTITIKAVDLGCTDDQIQSFRIYRNVLVDSPAHGLTDAIYPLTALDIPLLKPQETTITIGATAKCLTGINDQKISEGIQRAEHAAQVAEGVRGDVSTVQNQVMILETTINTTCEDIIMGALKEYSETGDLGQFREAVQSQLAVMADQISVNFSTTTESINQLDGDVQGRFEKLSKYIKFTGDTAISIGSGDSAITLEIDNDTGIVFKRNGVQFGWWDGVDFHTGNIVVDVNEQARLGNFAFIPRSDGSLMFLKVGDK